MITKNQQSKSRPYLFVSLVLMVIVFLMLNSCVTERQRAKICASCSSKEKDSTSVTRDTTRNEIVTVDTTYIPVFTEGPIQWLANPCDSLGRLKKIHKVDHKNGITSTIDSKGDSLKFGCREDSIRQVNKRHEIRETISTNIYNQKIKQLLAPSKTKFQVWLEVSYKWSAWFLWVCMILILLFLIAYWYLHRGRLWPNIKRD